MKQIFTFLFALLLIGTLNAQNANMIVFSEDGNPFFLVLNGVQQNQYAQTNVKVESLNAEFYKAKVIFEDKTLGEIDKAVGTPLGHETTYRIKQSNKGKYVLRMMTSVPLSATTANVPNQQVIVYHPTPTFEPTYNPPSPTHQPSHTNEPNNTNTNTTADGFSFQVDAPGVNMDMNVDYSTGSVNYNMNMDEEPSSHQQGEEPYYNPPQNPGNTYNPQPGYTPQPTYSGFCPSAMDVNAFNQAKNSINSKSFEDSKLTVAKQITAANCLTSAQVKGITELFDFEDSRVEYAKYAYNRTFDPQAYYVVNDAFDFESSIEELNNYIGTIGTPAPQPVPTHQPQQPTFSHNNNPTAPCQYPMSTSDFAQARQTISKQSFDDSRLKIAKQVISANCITVTQVKDLMGLMTYEKNRLELAKFAYAYTSDRNKYYLLNDGFTYKSSIDELDQFIQGQ